MNRTQRNRVFRFATCPRADLLTQAEIVAAGKPKEPARIDACPDASKHLFRRFKGPQ